MQGVKDLAYKFLKGEMLDYSTYSALQSIEKDPKLKKILGELAATEWKHAGIWGGICGVERGKVHVSRTHILLMLFLRRLLGPTFTVRLLELNEVRGAGDYASALKLLGQDSKFGRQLKQVLDDEVHHEKVLGDLLEQNETQLQYIKSIVFGLNDGLVEILAIVVGLAAIASSGAIVAVAGAIAGISGMLSMAGGAYLSAKSENLVKGATSTTPVKEAYFTGFYYFIGALLSILPFAFGLSGYVGIGVAVLVVSLAIVLVSFIISVITGVSPKRRMAEMLAISLGAAFATVAFSTFARIYWHVSI
ncbi:MAG: VIT1/CCC1 transporter family protein [Candidatus Micrarchaeia archaeon]